MAEALSGGPGGGAAPAASPSQAGAAPPGQEQVQKGKPQGKGQPQGQQAKAGASAAKPIPQGAAPGKQGKGQGSDQGSEPRPSRPRLPGVLSRDDVPFLDRLTQEKAIGEEDEGSDEGGEGTEGDRGDGRDASGRFVAQKAGTDGEGADDSGEEAESGKKPDLPASQAQPAAPVKFLGKQYKSLADVEQLHRTLQGVHRSQQDSIRNLTGERDYGYKAAHAWIKEVEQRDAKIAELEARLGGSAQAGAAGAGAASAPGAATADFKIEDVLESIDGDAFEQAATQFGLPSAAKLLAADILKVVTEKLVPSIRSGYEQALAPLQGEAQQRQMEAQQQQLIDSVASLKLPDGNPAFPEVSDGKALREIGALWAQSGLPPEVALTPQGFMLAISNYRMLKQMTGFGGEAAPELTPESINAAAGLTAEGGAPPTAAGAAALVEADAGRETPLAGGDARLPADTRRFLRSLTDTNLVDKKLGFSRNRKEAFV